MRLLEHIAQSEKRVSLGLDFTTLYHLKIGKAEYICMRVTETREGAERMLLL